MRAADGARLTSRALGGLKWALLGSAGQTLLSLAIVMALSRLLTPEDFGRIAIAAIFLALADTAGRRGVGPAIVQRPELTEGHVATGFALSLGIGAALAGALFAAAPLVGEVSGEPAVAPLLKALSLGTVLSALGVVSEHLLRRELRFREVMAASVLSQALGGGLVAVAVALLDHGVWALVWGMLARQCIFALAVLAWRPPPRRLRFRGREAAELLRTGAGFSAIALLDVAARHGVHLIVARTLGAAPLGLFTRAYRLGRAPAVLSPVLSGVLMPAMALRQDRRERIGPVYLNGVEMLFLAAFPASLAVAAAAPEIVRVVLGGQWDAAAPALSILALAGGFEACNALHAPVARATGAVWRESWRRALFVALAAAGAWLGSRWGLAGVAAGVAAARIVQHALMAQLALSLLGTGWRRLGRRLAPGLWTGLWATPALWAAVAVGRDAALPAWAAVAAGLAAWAPAAAAAVWLAPPFARPAFAHWALAQLPFAEMGRPGRVLRGLCRHLARRWPAEAASR